MVLLFLSSLEVLFGVNVKDTSFATLEASGGQEVSDRDFCKASYSLWNTAYEQKRSKPCGLEAIHKFDQAKYTKDIKEKKIPTTKDYATLPELVKFTLHVLNKYKFPHWIYFGSLLGLERSGGIIPGDWDCDIVIPHRCQKLIYKKLKHHIDQEKDGDNKKTIEPPRDDHEMNVEYASNDGKPTIDLYPYKFNAKTGCFENYSGDEEWRKTAWTKRGWAPVPAEWIIPLKKSTFFGALRPNEPAKLLQMAYGYVGGKPNSCSDNKQAGPAKEGKPCEKGN